ncbi:MAG: PIN domain-containing protein [Paludibacteraceae bacterium]|nr:PIN domain-containing protein [Paludibacteraceae bacterium]
MKRTTINKLISQNLQPTKYVFIDTCAILDVLRLPAKYENQSDLLAQYLNLLSRVEIGDIVIVTSCMVYVELQANYNRALTTESDWENKLSKDIRTFEGYSQVAGLLNGHEISTLYNTVNIQNFLNNIYNELTRRLIYLPEKFKYDKFSMERVAGRIPPAAGKTEYKDCYIWGTCIDLARQINQHDTLSFFTTNTKDFTINANSPYIGQFSRDAPNVTLYTDIRALMKNV